MLQELTWFIAILTPAGLGVLAAWGIHKLPEEWQSFTGIGLIIIVIAATVVVFHDAEDGWGPILMCWPLSGVLTGTITRFILKRKYPVE